MKKLLVTGSVALAFLLPACASTDGGGGGFQVTHTDPITEMTKGACCLKPSDQSPDQQ